jgi:aspartyl/asparaginyl beta-hydroxylase (cupin superfamily)
MKKRKLDFILFHIIKLPSLLVNGFYDLWTGGAKRPKFYDIDNVYPHLRVFDKNFEAIYSEYKSVFEDLDALPNYNELDTNQNYISATIDKDKKWNVFMINAMGLTNPKNNIAAPITSKLVSETPGIFQAFFSILEPGKSVPAHSGAYRGYLRYHLGLDVPKDKKPQLRVHDEYHTWEKEKSVLFDDTWEHEVINNATEYRAILIIDVLRPMGSIPNLINRFVKLIVARTYGKNLMNNVLKAQNER